MLSVNSSFLLNDKGFVGIVFDDANFVRSDTIIVEQSTGDIHAMLNEKQMLIGHLTGKLIQAFSRQSKVMLSSMRSDGSVLDLEARLIVVH